MAEQKYISKFTGQEIDNMLDKLNTLSNLGTPLQVPSEQNKVFSGQFVADELIVNNIGNGYYCIRLTNTLNNEILVESNFLISEKIAGLSFTYYDSAYPEAHALQGRVNVKTLSLYNELIDGSETIVQSPTDYHIDIFKIG